ncbi:MAG TPA: hypothetical protein VGB92_19215 [Longimicrobium sp.]|jgi:hypothetical protein
MAHREFTDAGGTVWQAWDVVPSFTEPQVKELYAPGLESGRLCFECGEEKRRLVPAPHGWADCADAEFEAHLARAEVVSRRTTGPAPS